MTSTVTVNNPDIGNTSSPSPPTAPGSNCPSGGTDPGCTATIEVLTPALTITKTADATTAPPGRPSPTPSPSPTPARPRTPAPPSPTTWTILDDATYNIGAAAGTGTLSYAAPALTWTGDLAAGATADITYTVTVHNPATGDKLMIDTATSADAGSTCPPGSPGAGCTAPVPVLTPALTITKTASTPHHPGPPSPTRSLSPTPARPPTPAPPSPTPSPGSLTTPPRAASPPRPARHPQVHQPAPDLDRQPHPRRTHPE